MRSFRVVSKCARICLAIAILLTGYAAAAFGQSATGTITGTVTDAQGAAIERHPLNAVDERLEEIGTVLVPQRLGVGVSHGQVYSSVTGRGRGPSASRAVGVFLDHSGA